MSISRHDELECGLACGTMFFRQILRVLRGRFLSGLWEWLFDRCGLPHAINQRCAHQERFVLDRIVHNASQFIQSLAPDHRVLFFQPAFVCYGHLLDVFDIERPASTIVADED